MTKSILNDRRFQNTCQNVLNDLYGCKWALEDKDSLPDPDSPEEYQAMLRLVEVCKGITEAFDVDGLRGYRS